MPLRSKLDVGAQ